MFKKKSGTWELKRAITRMRGDVLARNTIYIQKILPKFDVPLADYLKVQECQ